MIKPVWLLLFLLLITACAPVTNGNSVPISALTPILNSAGPTTTDAPPTVSKPIVSGSTVSNNEYIAFNVVKESDAYFAFLPIVCLKNGQDCFKSIRYSPDIYQKDMASPLLWSPNGQKFVTITNLNGNQDLTIGAFAYGISEKFTIETPDREDCPTWSPDDQKILFTKEVDHNGETISELWVVNSDGAHSEFLTKGGCGNWSSDGQHVAYSIYSNDKSIAQKIYMIDISNKATSSLTTDLDYIGNAIYSPDGKRIAFEGVKGERSSIYLIDPNGSGFMELTLTFPEATSPVWSPDGQHLAFVTHASHTQPGEIYVVASNGRDFINLSNSPTWDDGYPSWSPDGDMIVFMSQREASLFNVYMVNRNGAGLKKLTKADSTTEFMYPSWQP